MQDIQDQDKNSEFGDDDPIMSSLQTRVELEGLSLGMKGVSIVNIDGIDSSSLMKPHQPSNMNEEFTQNDLGQIQSKGYESTKIIPLTDDDSVANKEPTANQEHNHTHGKHDPSHHKPHT